MHGFKSLKSLLRNYLFVVTFLLIAITAQALPFVPTTDPSAAGTKWYYLKTEGFYVVSGQYQATPSTTSANSNDYLWCFVGNDNSGYKVYNKQHGKYIGDEGYMITLGSEEENTIMYYRQRTNDTFYLWHTKKDNGVNLFFYLYYDSEYNELATYGTTGNETKGCFEVEEASDNPDPQPSEWTRYDINGVGYKYIDGGTSPYNNESANNLSDNDASTKYCGSVANCWATIEASTRVPVFQYSIVTANDSRQYAIRALRSWKLQGSNDNANWTDIDVQTDCPLMPFADQEEVVFYIGGGTTYRYFKFICTEGANSDCVQLSEVWINEQSHTWSSPTVTNPTCSTHGTKVYTCNDCKANKTELIDPTGLHSYQDGICTVCGKPENETILLDNGQKNPYRIKYLHQYRNIDNTWPEAPNGWNTVNFDDSKWGELMMPTASVGHSNGPYTNLIYNSYWYGWDNSYLFRRPFYIDKINPNATFTFRFVHDDNMVVYVNGQEVENRQGWTDNANNNTWDNCHQEVNIPASVFHAGNNVLAVYIQQNWGGAYFDCELTATNLSSDITVGDVNNDGAVNAADITALYNYILNGDTTFLATSDVNNDGAVNAGDVTAVYNIILGQN